MSGHRRFFADPRPEEFQNPDPRPEEFQNPDPRPEEFQNPDPRPEEFQNPDPRPEEFQNPDPRPEEFQNPDPDVANALQFLQHRLGGRGGGSRRPAAAGQPPVNLDAPVAARYSGFIIVRLSPHLELSKTDSDTTLSQAAKTLGLKGLASLLRRHRLGRSSKRLVALDDNPYVQENRPREEDVYDDDVVGQRSGPPSRDLYEMERKAATSDLPPLRSLASYWRVNVRDQIGSARPRDGELRVNGWEPGPDHAVEQILQQLNELVEVDRAYRELAVTDPAPDGARGDAYAGIQEHRQRAPIGIDARWAWDQGARGSGIEIVDLEQGWILDHEELTGHLPPIDLIAGRNRHLESDDYRGDHGTAVLGEIAARVEPIGAGDPGPNSVGVAGIAPEVLRVRVASHYDGDPQTPPNVADAVRQASRLLTAGDVLLLEVQRSYLPTEADDADFDAIRLASAKGIIVVEAAGNGETNLDCYVDDEGKDEGERVFDRRGQHFRESGAIMVGAAQADLPHNRFTGPVGVGSNYGSRLDCFGYGNRVVTAGYGTDPADQETRTYTQSFGGTSGAAPIVAGAALVVQGMHEARCGTRLSPWEMRGLLRNPATGTRQGRGVPGYVGVMPNLRAILKHRLQLVPDLYLRDHIGDTGAVPGKTRIGACPDIIPVAAPVADPDAAFGEGSSHENAYAGGHRCVVGQDHHIYLRLRNRGSQPVEVPEAKVYWAEVATLVTPDTWNELTRGRVRLLPETKNAPAGDTLVVSEPITWRTAEMRAALRAEDGDTRHLCFMAIVEDPNDEELVLPPRRPPYFDWREFRVFLRDHNSLALRNVHRVGPRRAGATVELPFIWSGTPDRARVFGFEIVQRLPEGARVELEVPAALVATLLRGRLWESDPQDGGLRSRLHLPARARCGFARVRLVAGARLPCRFRVIAGETGIIGGHSLAIRQLYRGEVVGQITWLF